MNLTVVKKNAFLVMLVVSVSAFAQEPADYVFTNGRVYTVDPDMPLAEAVAVKGERIVFVGTSEDAKAFIGLKTHIANLDGRMLMPGLVETHLHVMLGAVATSGVWLANIPDVKDVQREIREFALANPKRDVIFGWGYGSTLFGPEGPSKELLDEAVPDRAAFIVREDGHSAWANSKALEMAGINKETPDPSPPAGVFGRDARGNPTGAINGGPANLWTLQRLPGAITAESLRIAAMPLLEQISELGISTLFDAGAPIATDEAFDFLVKLDSAGDLPVRYTASHYINSASQADGAIDELKRLSAKYKSPNFRITTLKITTDGVVENRKAALLSPYLDVDGNGALNFTPEVISDLSVEAARNGYGVYMHTLGDRSVRAGLDAAEAVRVAGFNDTVITLSHCQLVDASDFPRFAKTGVFINSTGSWMQRYADEKTILGNRAESEYPYRDMIDEGVLFVNSSDFPATPIIDPFTHLEVSITRRPPGAASIVKAKNPRSALTLEEAIAAYTINGAKMLELNDQLGTIELGKRADLIILDRDITEIAPNKIHQTKVLFTMVDGTVRHDFLFDLGDASDAPNVEFSAGFEGIHRH